MKVLFNADDYGLTKGITDGIIQSHTEGIVTSTTLMMNGLAVEHAVEQAKKHPDLNVGIHLVLTWGKPLRNDVPNLIDSSGNFKYNKTYAQKEAPDMAQIEKEWRAQIEAFLKTGLPLHHIDSHHHVHGWDPVQNIIVKLAKEYDVPVRFAEHLKGQVPLLTDAIDLDFYEDGIYKDVFERLSEMDVDSVEIMVHPAFVDEDLKKVSSYTDMRQKELEILCRLELPDWASFLDNTVSTKK